MYLHAYTHKYAYLDLRLIRVSGSGGGHLCTLADEPTPFLGQGDAPHIFGQVLGLWVVVNVNYLSGGERRRVSVWRLSDVRRGAGLTLATVL